MSTLNNSSTYRQFNEISFQNEVYKKNDVIVISGSDGKEVAIINYIYESQDEYLLNVRRYIFARNLKKLFKKQNLMFDKKNEVVQDLTQCFDILLKQVIKKCTIAILCPDENIYYIEKNNLDPSDYYSCRFSVKGDQLFPLLIEQTTNQHKELSGKVDRTLFTPKTKAEGWNQSNMDIENTPITAISDNIEVYFDDDYFSPRQRNKVKRNLNSTFGNSPSKNKSILNYSVESVSDEDNYKDRLVVKLRLSRHAKKRNTDSATVSPPKMRKSTRNVTRKSYADYISPQKGTPTKRRLGSIRLSDNEDDFDPRKNKISKNTPKKDNPKGSKDNTPSKRTPQKSTKELNSSRTPCSTTRRKGLQLINTEDLNNRSFRSCRNIALSYQEESDSLNNSLRTNLFKNSVKKVELEKNNNLTSDSDDTANDSSQLIRISLERLNLSNDSTFTHLEKDSSDSSSSVDESPLKKRRPTKTHSTTPTTPKRTRILNRTTTPKHVDKTPQKSAKQTPKGTPKTPRNKLKLIRDGTVTPSIQERSKKIKGDSTPLMKARSQLHVSYVPLSLPCREKEYCDIYNFIEGKLLDGCGGCMYISGVPGTGKTATVTSVINHLQKTKNVPKFTFVNINGMRLTEPRQSYVEILKQLKGKTVSWEQAQNTLEEIFIKVKKMEPVVMLIDELDILCNKRQDVVYNLLDWPTKAKNQLVVISIANTMDLPERLLMNRVTSRLGLTRLTFQAYTFKQLQEIVTKRLCGTDSFNPDAVQFVARKVASVSGDARRALDICRRAAEIAESEGKTQLVTMHHVNEALNAMITQPKVLAIKSCSKLEQLILQSIVAEVERTGVEESTFGDIFKMLLTCAAIEGFKMVSSTIAQSAVTRLSACRLILAEQKCSSISQKIILNVSVDDVYYALQKNRT